MVLASRRTYLLILAFAASCATPHQHAHNPAQPPAPAQKPPIASPPSPTDELISKWTDNTQHHPDHGDAWVGLGNARMQKARETMDAAWYGRAQAAYEKALALDPENVAALTGLAWVAGCRHQFEQSVEWANKALAIDPVDPTAFGLLGDAAVERGNYEAAFNHYQKMLDIAPNLASYSRAAHLLYLTGDTHGAVALMKKAIAAGGPHAENTAWCYAQLALILWSTGDLLEAEQVLKQALARAPHNHHLLVGMGRLQVSRKEYRAAIEYYQRAIAVSPQHEAIVALGDLHLAMGDRQAAEAQYALVEELHERHESAGVHGHLLLARFYADHDRSLAEALRMAEQDFREHPNVFAADTLAWCYYKNGRYEKAWTAMRRALSQGTPDPSFLFHAGMIRAKLGDRAAARKYLQQALTLNPRFHPVDAALAAATLQELRSPAWEEDRPRQSATER
jgi:tetratricopeptide (TPR) repeat protein